MGWWVIDPKTGAPRDNSHSSLSKPPEFVLLNAVPGADDDAQAHYLGDGPLDMVYSFITDVRAMGPTRNLSDADARWLLSGKPVPSLARFPGLNAKALKEVQAFWKDVDTCYEDDWNRPATEAEKKWITEDAVRRLREG